MKNRKIEEREFHDFLRSDSLKKDQVIFKKFTSNYKFYKIDRASSEFYKNWLKEKSRNNIRILDYCCGEGDISLFIAKNCGFCIGIDISEASIQKCREKSVSEKIEKDILFMVMDAEKLAFVDNSFDIVICAGVLHHLDIKKAFPELSRVLKPDGEIICIEPLKYNPFIQLYRKLTPHLRTKYEVEHILTKIELGVAKDYFKKMKLRFFHLATLLAIPFCNLPKFDFMLNVLERIDKGLLKLPLIKWWAWQVIFVLSSPKKET